MAVAPVGWRRTMATPGGVNGPPMVMYLRTGADQHQTRDSMAATFLLYMPLSRWRWPLGGEVDLR